MATHFLTRLKKRVHDCTKRSLLKEQAYRLRVATISATIPSSPPNLPIKSDAQAWCLAYLGFQNTVPVHQIEPS